MKDSLFSLALVFGGLSLMSFGGGTATLAEMQRQVIDVQNWVTTPQFGAVYAIAQALPGPSSLFVALIGYRVAGLLGAIVAAVAMYLPSSLAMYLVARFWGNAAKTRAGRAIEKGLAPLAVGLVFAGAVAVARVADHDPQLIIVTIVTTLIFTLTEWNPILVLLVAGACGLGLELFL